MKDSQQDLAATLNEFRAALRSATGKRALVAPGTRLHDLALAVGRPELGGFAPVAGKAVSQAGPRRGSAVAPGEGRSLVAGHLAVADAAGQAVPRSGGDASSYRVILAQAKEQAAMARAGRQAGRMALNLPAREEALARRSFAPMAVGGNAEAAALYPAKGSRVSVPGLRLGTSVHEAVAAAEGASYGFGMTPGGQQAETRPEPAPGAVTPFDIRQALDEYFFQQSRLPPNGGAAFNPLLSPLWAGLKIPG